jgi:hypothetical protein
MAEVYDGPTWVDNGKDADTAMEQILEAAVCGYDSEFYGVDISEESCVGRSILDVFSIAIPTERTTPLGYKIPRSWVFDSGLIHHPSVKAFIESPDWRKVVHNLPVDSHTARNAGVRLRGGLDTLNQARWVYPERACLPKGNYDLDSLCKWRVGFGKTEDFDEFLGYYVDEPYLDRVEKKFCLECMAPCRKKKPPHDQKFLEWTTVTRTRKVRKIEDISLIRPGHPKFGRYLAYAAADAELALILWQMMQIDGQKERVYPYGAL